MAMVLLRRIEFVEDLDVVAASACQMFGDRFLGGFGDLVEVLKEIAPLRVVRGADVLDRAGGPGGEQQGVRLEAAPGVEASGDCLPEEPDVLDAAVLSNQEGGDLDAVTETPSVSMPSCLLGQQEPCEVDVDQSRKADQVFKELLTVLPPQIDGQAIRVMLPFELQKLPELRIVQPPGKFGNAARIILLSDAHVGMSLSVSPVAVAR